MSKSAIIVLRHGCDGGTTPTDEIIDFNPNITINNQSSPGTVDGNKVTIVINRLGALGLEQAHGLENDLPEFLTQYCPVSRIVTEGPGDGTIGTPNPVYTIRYAAMKLAESFKQSTGGNLKMDLYNNEAYKTSNLNTINGLLKDGKGQFSTVVSWEAKGMWRHEDGGFQEDSILAQLGHHITNQDAYTLMKENKPYKGQMIYVFELNDDASLTLKIFKYNLSKDVKFKPVNSKEDWPSNHCS